MTAGLPKSVGYIVLSLAILVGISLLGMSQEVQSPSVVIDPIDDVQTEPDVLQPVFDVVESNPEATEEQKADLIAAFEAAEETGVLTPEQALEMLALVTWDSQMLDGDLQLVYDALLSTLDGLASGEIMDDPLAVLGDTVNKALTPAGTLNALGKAGAEDENLSEVAALVADGMPPGILIRVVKGALRDGLDPAAISALLADLEAEAVDQSWGQAANAVTDQGQSKNKHQENEENQNENDGENEEPEEETEKNSNGSSGNNGKAKGKDK